LKRYWYPSISFWGIDWYKWHKMTKIDLLRVLSHKMIGLILWLILDSLSSSLSLEWSINYPCHCVCSIEWLIVLRHNGTTMTRRTMSTKAYNVRDQERFSTSLKDNGNPYVLIGWALKKVMLLYPSQTHKPLG
jgi:hypothetical protein